MREAKLQTTEMQLEATKALRVELSETFKTIALSRLRHRYKLVPRTHLFEGGLHVARPLRGPRGGRPGRGTSLAQLAKLTHDHSL